MSGFGGNDFFRGSEGADVIDGSNGTDTVRYGGYAEFPFLSSPILHFGGSVDVDLQRATQKGAHAEGDVLISIENVIGSRGEDIIRGNSANNVLAGFAGDDFLEGRDGDDVLSGDADLLADIGTEIDFGGNDFLDGSAGNDDLFGDAGNDILLGGSGNDELFGGLDDDLLRGGTGFNVLDGGAGFDTSSYGDAAHGIQIIFSGSNRGIVMGLGDNTLADSFENIERFIGSDFADTMAGSTLAETFESGGGNDLLDGRGGADTLIGGNGTDTATYAFSSSAVSVNLGVMTVVNGVLTQTTVGTGSGGDAQGDTLNSIEIERQRPGRQRRVRGRRHHERRRLRHAVGHAALTGLATSDDNAPPNWRGVVASCCKQQLLDACAENAIPVPKVTASARRLLYACLLRSRLCDFAQTGDTHGDDYWKWLGQHTDGNQQR